MIRSTGTCGLIFSTESGPPISLIAWRIAARSTTAGTPVKSCKITLAGLKGTSTPSYFPLAQSASISICFSVIECPS